MTTMRTHTRAHLMILFAATWLILAASACGESGTGMREGLSGVCRSCVGDQPQGPNESQEACAAFAEDFGCESFMLTGSCSNSNLADKAACHVTACTTQPVCPSPQ